MIRMRTTGVADAVARINACAVAADRATRAALRYEAEKIMTASLREVPVLTGRLKNSRFVELAGSEGKVPRVVLGYRASYAWYQHEKPYRHESGKWHFLVDPLMRAYSGFAERVARQVKKGMAAAAQGKAAPGEVSVLKPGSEIVSRGAALAKRKKAKAAKAKARKRPSKLRRVVGRAGSQTAKVARRVGKKARRAAGTVARRAGKRVRRIGKTTRRRVGKVVKAVRKRIRRRGRGRRR